MNRALLGAVLVVTSAAHARTVATGAVARLRRAADTHVGHLYWARIVETEASVLAFPGHVSVGDRYDLIDVHGWVGRMTVDEIDDNACGSVTYQEASGKLAPRRAAPRDVSEPLLAIGPVVQAPPRARVLRSDEVTTPPPPGKLNLIAVDLDADGTADLARYVIYDCRAGAANRTDGTCIETWARDDGRWKLVERGAIPPCY